MHHYNLCWFLYLHLLSYHCLMYVFIACRHRWEGHHQCSGLPLQCTETADQREVQGNVWKGQSARSWFRHLWIIYWGGGGLGEIKLGCGGPYSVHSTIHVSVLSHLSELVPTWKLWRWLISTCINSDKHTSTGQQAHWDRVGTTCTWEEGGGVGRDPYPQ